MTREAIVMAVATLAFTGTAAAGQDQWPRFRGPMAGAVADDPTLLNTWSEMRWKPIRA